MSPTQPGGMENRIIADPELLRVKPLIQERCDALARHLAGKHYPRFAPTLLSQS